MKRNPSVELMRILACYIVLSCHCNFVIIVENAQAPYKEYLAAILGDPVAIFWMITGFFLFNNTNYKKLWKHTFTKILIPLLLLYVVDFHISNYILGKATLLESIQRTPAEYLDFFKKLFSLHAPTELSSAHTWYVLAYVLIILIFPLLKSFCDYLDKSSKGEVVFLIISGALFILNDFFINDLLDFSFHGAGVILPASIEIIWGHIIYRHRELFTKKIYILVAPVVFFGINALRVLLQMYRESNLTDLERHLYRWSSSFSIICAICVLAFAFSAVNSKKESFINKAICAIASYTYPIYLIHALVQEELAQLGYFNIMHDYLLPHMSETWYSVITVYGGGILMFILCIIICIVLRLIKKLVMLPFKYSKKKA